MNEMPKWNVPGWDWAEGDNAWLDAGAGDGDTSIFFIHGGRIRHQAHIREGHHPIEEFVKMIRDRAEGLDDPYVVWETDTGGGDAGLWVEGTRAPNGDDLSRLQAARDHQAHTDRSNVHGMRARHPEWFSDAAPRWDSEKGVWINDPCYRKASSAGQTEEK